MGVTIRVLHSQRGLDGIRLLRYTSPTGNTGCRQFIHKSPVGIAQHKVPRKDAPELFHVKYMYLLKQTCQKSSTLVRSLLTSLHY